MRYGDNFQESVSSDFRHPSGPVFYDDTQGLHVFGGSEFRTSFRGYIGQATLYRNVALDARQVSYVYTKLHILQKGKLNI